MNNFLIFNDNKIEESYKQLWATLEWRRKCDVNSKIFTPVAILFYTIIFLFRASDISENDARIDLLINGNIYIRGCDLDGKKLIFFRIRIYSRGKKTIDDLRWFFLYWVSFE